MYNILNILICFRNMVDCAIFMYANENLNSFYNMLFHNYTLSPISPGGGSG